MVEELIAKVFATRNAVQAAHWRSKSYSEHEALGDFYTAIIDKLDAIVEMYQGAFDKVSVPEVEPVVGKDIIKHLTDEARWINDNREAISGDVCALENALDELAALYHSALYKLRFLS